MHDADALSKAHVFPQLPQLVGLFRSVSQPLPGSPSQSAKPGSQSPPHVPAEHVGVEPAVSGQAMPQPPQ
jgi:hypothetical protein